MGRIGTGTAAAVGSFVGLIVGGLVGETVAKGEKGRAKAGTLAIAGVLGTAVGAFSGAAIATPAASATLPPAPGA